MDRKQREYLDDTLIEQISILAQLQLTEDEKRQAKEDMNHMLDYFALLSEADTDGQEPAVQVLPVSNVFREDEVTNTNHRESLLSNAPETADGMFIVPKSFA